MGGRNLDQFRSKQANQQAKPKEPTGTTPKRNTDSDESNKKS